MNPHYIEWRDQYLKAFLTNKSNPVGQRIKKVYTNEGYIHHHHRSEKDLLHHPSNPKESKAPHKGKRFFFISAIQNDPNIDESKLIPNSYWAFCPTMKNGLTGDYHKVFDSSNYFKWCTENLILNLNVPSLIIFENAKYQKAEPQDTPKVSKLKEAEVLLELTKTNIYIYLNLSAIDTKKQLRNWINKKIDPAIVLEARRYVNEVLFTPAYYSDLQPIELIWARIKGSVARSHSKSTTLQEVGEKLDKKFLEL